MKSQSQTYFYSFADRSTHVWNSGQTGAANMIGVGLEVPAGASRDVPITMDADATYEFHGFSVIAYEYDEQNAQYLWYRPGPGTWWLGQWDHELNIGTPLHKYLEVKIIQESPTKQYIVGAVDQWANPGQDDAVNPAATQGYENGREPFRQGYHLIPPRGVLVIRLRNIHPTVDMIVAGCLHGRKVRPEGIKL